MTHANSIQALRLLKATTVLAALLATAQAQASPALAKKHGCLACHALDAPMVGPAYRAVAERYAGQADAAAKLEKKLREGGAGSWGDMPMPPQTAVPPADAKRLVAWILGGAK